jgi:hypothetical protein
LDIGWGEGSLQRDRENLPISMSLISPFLETHEDFALRRIIATADHYREAQLHSSFHQFVKKAGLNPEVRTPKVIAAVYAAIAALEN